VPTGYLIRWEVWPLFADRPGSAEVRGLALMYGITLAQGLSSAKHGLEIEAAAGAGPSPRARRGYRPPVK
jgi:hypothetical protein